MLRFYKTNILKYLITSYCILKRNTSKIKHLWKNCFICFLKKFKKRRKEVMIDLFATLVLNDLLFIRTRYYPVLFTSDFVRNKTFLTTPLRPKELYQKTH